MDKGFKKARFNPARMPQIGSPDSNVYSKTFTRVNALLMLRVGAADAGRQNSGTLVVPLKANHNKKKIEPAIAAT